MLYTYGAVLGMVYNFIPFMVPPIYVALEQMDKRLLDAASDLGASRWKAFRHITLPQSKSGIMTGAVLVYVSTSGMFVVTDILGGAKSSMISNIIQRQFLGARNWPFGAALSVIFVITSLVLILLFNRAMQARHQRVGREISEEEESPALGIHSFLMMAFIYVPIIMIIIYSFNNTRLSGNWEGFTLDWYVSLFENRHVMEALMNSLTVAVISTIISTLLGTAAALSLRNLGRRGRAA